MKPYPVSPEMQALVGESEIPPTQALKKIWVYIKDNDLQLHVYKNHLQHYAQKKNLSLLECSCEIDGPPEAPLFRASVRIGGSTYTSPLYFDTLKDSEHAAAN